MDTLFLSRLQFAVATYFHFLFVPLTLGLSLLVALHQTMWVRTGDEDWRRATRFWGRLFTINFAIGVVTGITLEFQFGTNWSRYAAFVGDVFGALLAIEASATFFLESTFIAVWIFGWERLSKRAHLASIWLVALASNLSAFWILVANAWMQHPVGYALRNGRAELTDFVAVLTQPFALLEVAHTLGGAYTLAAFFVLGISSWHLLRGHERALFGKSFGLAAAFALFGVALAGGSGHQSTVHLATAQPMKLAAAESLWETTRGAPMHLALWPDQANERNAFQVATLPGLLSLLATGTTDGEVKGLRAVPPGDRPPVLPCFLSFRGMVALGGVLGALALWAFARRASPEASPLLLKLLVWSIPLPYLANELGWTLAEVGRQPWIVYGVMRTADAVSPVATIQVALSALGFIAVYSLLGLADFYLLFKYARRGPTPAAA